jgi:SAM-dependent methyltransferase
VTSYYVSTLAGTRLRRRYEIAPPRARQYLESEIEHLLDSLSATDHVLELGCGYGRVALRIAAVAEKVVGIDVSEESLSLARQLTGVSGRTRNPRRVSRIWCDVRGSRDCKGSRRFEPVVRTTQAGTAPALMVF